MLIVKLAILDRSFALKRWLLLQHLLLVLVGQFAPKYHGQFAPKQWVSLRRNGVVSFIIISSQGDNLQKTFKEAELLKYRTILEKLTEMLVGEQDYSEKNWQLEILQIVQLLYPKYISALSNVPIRDKFVGDRIIDFLLVDVNGHIDIIEIKKPFENSIMTHGKHRNNHIPLRELSGTIMQLEKYIFFLNRWGGDGEKYLTEKYHDQLPADIEIRITNPNGIIIMGRENKLNQEQQLDFEVVKRKYKNVVDIITYDNLIHRLKVTIEQIQKT